MSMEVEEGRWGRRARCASHGRQKFIFTKMMFELERASPRWDRQRKGKGRRRRSDGLRERKGNNARNWTEMLSNWSYGRDGDFVALTTVH